MYIYVYAQLFVYIYVYAQLFVKKSPKLWLFCTVLRSTTCTLIKERQMFFSSTIQAKSIIRDSQIELPSAASPYSPADAIHDESISAPGRELVASRANGF